MTAEKDGFAVALVDDVQVQIGARLRVDLKMPVGQLTEKVEVRSSQPLVETDSSQRGQVITGEQIRALPLISREYSSLALLTTGVKLAGSSLTTGNTPREGAFNVNGLRSTFNNFLIDGVDNNAYGTSNQGFSNQVMQPLAGRDRRVQGRHQQHERRVRPRRRRDDQRQLPQRHQHAPRHRLGVPARHLDERDRLLQAGHRQADARSQPVRRRVRRTARAQPRVLLRRLRGIPADAQRRPASPSIATPAQRQGILTVDVRDPRTGVVYPAGTPVPMTDFARKVLSALPDTNLPGNANNYTTLQEFTADSNKGGGKVDVQLTPTVVDVRALRRAQPRHRRSAEHPAALGRRRQRSHLRAQPPARPRLDVDAVGPVAARGALRLLVDEAGKNPPALGSQSAFDQFGLPGLPTDERIAGGLPTQLITGYSDLGRQATNPQWQYPTVYNPKINYTWTTGAHSLKTGYEFQHIDTEVQDVNPLYGRDTYNGSFTRPAGAAHEQSLQSRRLHARPARAVRAQQRPGREPAPRTCTSPTCRTTGGIART